eukprot:13061292-Alexandrium_andersonii.AAC.1
MQSSVDKNRDDQKGMLNATFDLDLIAPHVQRGALDSVQGSHVQPLARSNREVAKNNVVELMSEQDAKRASEADKGR